jgi:hypothetical protein
MRNRANRLEEMFVNLLEERHESPGAVCRLSTILRKEIRRFLRIWPQTLLPSAITMSLYFVIFGSLIGSRIGEMGGFSYMEFVVPG